LLVISGTLAGMIPASRAIKIKPIDALRTEI
jgi:ABC-type antimicrobial peptide transport system permease subunit